MKYFLKDSFFPFFPFFPFTLFTLLFGISIASAAFLVPANDGFVTDIAAILTDDQESALETKLRQYKEKTSNEIAIVILPDLAGEPIENAGLEIGRKWGIGSKKNNGILMLVDYTGRNVRFDVGYGLEGAVPDIVTKGIIEMDIVPNFRDGKYGEGLAAAVDALEKHIGGEFTADRYADTESGGPSGGLLFLIAFLLFQWLVSILGRTKSWWLGGVFGGVGGVILAFAFGWWLTIPVLIPLGLFLDFLVSKNYHSRGRTSWWAGGGWGPGGGFGSGGGRGGFGGFGGGGFGGGGGSGRW